MRSPTLADLIDWLNNYPREFRIDIIHYASTNEWSFEQWFFGSWAISGMDSRRLVTDPDFINGLRRAKIVFDCYGKPVLDELKGNK